MISEEKKRTPLSAREILSKRTLKGWNHDDDIIEYALPVESYDRIRILSEMAIIELEEMSNKTDKERFWQFITDLGLVLEKLTVEKTSVFDDCKDIKELPFCGYGERGETFEDLCPGLLRDLKYLISDGVKLPESVYRTLEDVFWYYRGFTLYIFSE